MSKVKVTREIFKDIKLDFKDGLKNKEIEEMYGLSHETIRLIKICPNWGQWQQNKVNRSVVRHNDKYSKTLIGRIRLFLGV